MPVHVCNRRSFKKNSGELSFPETALTSELVQKNFPVLAAIKVFPNNLKAYYRQAVALKHQKRYTEAVQAAQRGQEIQPISVSSCVGEAVIVWLYICKVPYGNGSSD